MNDQAHDTDGFYLDRTQRLCLEADLNQLSTWLAEDLDTVITKQTKYTTNSTTGKRRRKASDEAALPYNETASAIAHDLTGTLQAWVDEICAQRHYPHPGMLRANTAAKWLRNHTIALALCEQAQTAADEIHDSMKRAIHAVDRPRFRTYQGQCEVCDADLWAHREATDITCHECNEVINKQDNDTKIMAHLETRSFTATELVDIIADRFGTNIKPKTIHDLAYRRTNPIQVRGKTYDSQMLYRAGDVFQALRNRKVIA